MYTPQPMVMPRIITGALATSLALSIAPKLSWAQFDPSIVKHLNVFDRPASLNRYRYTDRSIEERLTKSVDTVEEDSITTFESRRLLLRAAQMRRIAEESAIRKYSKRQERTLHRLEREQQRVIESKTTPATGGTYEEVLRGVPAETHATQFPTVQSRVQAIKTRSVRPASLVDPDNPCSGMSHKRLVLCLIHWQEKLKIEKTKAAEEKEGEAEQSTGSGSGVGGS